MEYNAKCTARNSSKPLERQISVRLDEPTYKRLLAEASMSGLKVSDLIRLKLKFKKFELQEGK